jgi:hypothetical protein
MKTYIIYTVTNTQHRPAVADLFDLLRISIVISRKVSSHLFVSSG